MNRTEEKIRDFVSRAAEALSGYDPDEIIEEIGSDNDAVRIFLGGKAKAYHEMSRVIRQTDAETNEFAALVRDMRAAQKDNAK